MGKLSVVGMALVLACLVALVSVPALAFVVNFPDSKLEQVIRDAIGKSAGDIESSDLVGLTDLNAANKTIKNLEGLQHCTDLVTLDLGGNYINDLTPLASLLNLEDLELNDNDFSSVVPLAGLVKLTHLSLTFCSKVSDISPLAALVNLIILEASACRIEDISAVAGMINLTDAYLQRNRITDITPLAGLANLSLLSLGENQIADISPLSALTNLTGLVLDDNQIVDISALVDNVRVGSGDMVDLHDNCLSLALGSHDMRSIQTLIDRGVNLVYEPQLNSCQASEGGDINSDGSINMLDVRLCLQIATGVMFGTTTERVAGDVDGDGDVDMEDAQILAEYVVRIRTTLP